MGLALWPLFLVILSNVCYHTCAKSASPNAEPFAALVITYLVAATCALIAYLFLGYSDGVSMLHQIRQLNWANYAMGLAIIGLEGGYLYMYRLGWNMSIGPIITYVILSIALLAIGLFVFGEQVTWRQVAGIFICLIGIALINWK